MEQNSTQIIVMQPPLINVDPFLMEYVTKGDRELLLIDHLLRCAYDQSAVEPD